MVSTIITLVIGCAVGYYISRRMTLSELNYGRSRQRVIKPPHRGGYPPKEKHIDNKFFLENLNELYSKYDASSFDDLFAKIEKNTKINYLNAFLNLNNINDIVDEYETHKMEPIQVSNKIRSGKFITTESLKKRLESLHIPKEMVDDDPERLMSILLNYYYGKALDYIVNTVSHHIETLKVATNGTESNKKKAIEDFKNEIEFSLSIFM